MRIGLLPPTPEQLEQHNETIKRFGPLFPIMERIAASKVTVALGHPGILHEVMKRTAGECFVVAAKTSFPADGFKNYQGQMLDVLGRPFIKAMYNAPGFVLPHELVHLQLDIARSLSIVPRRPVNQHAREELEAHRVSAAILQAIPEKLGVAAASRYYHEIGATMQIEAIRRKHNANEEDPYVVTRGLLDDLDAAGLYGYVVGRKRRLTPRQAQATAKV